MLEEYLTSSVFLEANDPLICSFVCKCILLYIWHDNIKLSGLKNNNIECPFISCCSLLMLILGFAVWHKYQTAI